jgi:uncharacterized protein YceH (UPF0502 family)
MDFMLSPIEARVLGSLIEKELSTPEYYPLTLNALVNACNQKSNRDPVMTLGEEEVLKALENLRFEQLVHKSAEGVRATKYCHNLEGRFKLEPGAMAVMAELLLRGPQTQGELRARTERMYKFQDLGAIEEVTLDLTDRDDPLVVRLPRQPGHKESRYAHLLYGEISLETGQAEPDGESLEKKISKIDRLLQLEEEVATLRTELDELRHTFELFKSQFD